MRIDDDEPVRQPTPRGMSTEGRRTLAACFILLGFVGFIVVFGKSVIPFQLLASQSLRSGGSALPGEGARTAAGGALESDDDLKTGSILYVPDHGNVCRKKVIDNATWRIREAGAVLCDDAVSWNANSAGNRISPIARIEAIRDGFKK